VQNLSVGGYVHGHVVVGSIAGSTGQSGSPGNGQILNSTSHANVIGDAWVGGLVGETSGGSSINSSYASGDVTGGDLVGGLVGENHGTISNSYTTGNITGRGLGGGSGVGGLVGFNQNSGTINNSFATGSVQGAFRVGGLVGLNVTPWHRQAAVSNSIAFNAEIMTSIGIAYAARIVGYNQMVFGSIGILDNNHAHTDVLVNDIPRSGTSSSDLDGENVTTASLPELWASLDWDFTNIWLLPSTPYSLPTLRNVPSVQSPTLPIFLTPLPPPAGAGTPDDPFLLGTINDLLWMANNPMSWQNGHFRLTADIGSALHPWSHIIGSRTVPFTGNFDGNGHTVKLHLSNIYMHAGVGLFGTVGNGGIVQNLIVDGIVSGYNSHDVGSVAGFVDEHGKILNVASHVNVGFDDLWPGGGDGGDVGGLVGRNRGAISNSYTTGDIVAGSGHDNAVTGGLVGSNLGTISNSVALNATVSGRRYAGWNTLRIGFGAAGLTNNHARADMLVNGTTRSSTDANSHNGADLIFAELTEAFWLGLGWCDEIWDFSNPQRPILRGSTQASTDQDAVDAAMLLIPNTIPVIGIIGGDSASNAAKASAVEAYLRNLQGMSEFGVTITVTHNSGNTFDVTVTRGSATEATSVTVILFADPNAADVAAALEKIPDTVAEIEVEGGENASNTAKANALRDYLESINGMDALDVTITVTHQTGNIFAVTVTKGAVTQSTSVTVERFIDPNEIAPPVLPTGFRVTIDDNESPGIVGQRRTITITPQDGHSTSGRFLLVQITESAAGSRPSVMAIALQNTTANTADVVTISYQHAGATIDVWLFDTLVGINLVTNDIPPILAHDSTRP